MARIILSVGGLFFALLLAVLFILRRFEISSMLDLFCLPSLLAKDTGVSGYEQSLFFTLFVWLQFWNMFNARAYATGKSAFHFKGALGFISIAWIIVIGQVLIVSFGGEMFSVQPLTLQDWLLTFVITSPILLIGEVYRIMHHRK